MFCIIKVHVHIRWLCCVRVKYISLAERVNMRVTIKRIAELSNVSRGTVDRVLNDRSGVKSEVRERVKRIAEALNYKPNLLGKALVNLNDTLRIGIILTPEDNPFIEEVKLGIQRAYNEYRHYGIEIVTRMLPSLDPAAQLAILNELVQENVQAIGMIPLDHDIIRKQTNSLVQEGIPVITFNSRIDGVDELCFIGQNHVLGGACAGGLMGRLLPGGGKIGVIISSYTLACHVDRLSGFKTRLEQKYPNAEIISVLENMDKDDLAFERTMNLINNHDDLNGIYITGGGVAGVGKALKVAQKDGVIRTISHDFVDGTAELLHDGTLFYAIGQNPQLQGYLVVKLFFDYFFKKEPPSSRYIEIPVEIATEDNIMQNMSVANMFNYTALDI